ncbi:MAG: transglutaminase domain-containing protein [Desulfobacteraceae bacterium]|nr:transglutaminase domain-containing protein [Desulfobacteraceae bacterium]
MSLENDPLKILNYVKNRVEYIPYYGSKKGADATLIESAGNDFDQASLLIALLRAGDENGEKKIPARYRIANIKTDLETMMNLFGVSDPMIVGKMLSRIGAPYILYVDNGNPAFFVLEHVYVEAYISYDYTRGLVQGEPGQPEKWVPMDPSLATYRFSQSHDIIQEMGFDAPVFFENYLTGMYQDKKPIQAFQQEIETFLAANYSSVGYDDILLQKYFQDESLEYIPDTMPYEIVDPVAEFAVIPENLKHKITFIVQNKEETQDWFNYTVNVAAIAHKELVVTHIAADADDQAVLDSYGSIYDVVPLSLVHMKPVLKVNGDIMAGGGAGDFDISMGHSQQLKMIFTAPEKELTGEIIENELDVIEKEIIVGNAEAIAINTDVMVSSAIRPPEDTASTEYIPNRKLYHTAHNYLSYLQRSHEELASVMGGSFVNSATRAIVFNGIDVTYQNGEPYCFAWKGLKIDTSAVVDYFHRLGNEVEKYQTEFLYVFGLELSLHEAIIFEEDFGVEGMSTVKGLRMINQGLIPGVQVKKITLANKGDIETLGVSEGLKVKFRDAVNMGNILYTPTGPYVYQNWEGLVYVNIEADAGSGEYIIGEGLNGGYTVCGVSDSEPNTQRRRGPEDIVCWWSDSYFFMFNLNPYAVHNIQATISGLRDDRNYYIGESITYEVIYEGTDLDGNQVSWLEKITIDTNNLMGVQSVPITSEYGTNTYTTVNVLAPLIEFITPAGDPVAAPVDSGDGQNQFVFNNASPGILEINFKARVTPNSSDILNAAANRVKFSVRPIDNYIMTWDSANPDGRASISGSNLIAKVTFTGLPDNNRYFGTKRATIKFCSEMITFLCSDIEETNIEIFFSRDDSNNPGGSDPNWYHYWSQALGVEGDHSYDATRATSATIVLSATNWTIEIGSNANWTTGNQPTGQTFINGFWATNLHEFWHRDHRVHNFSVHGSRNPPAAEDIDGDGICDREPTDPPGHNGGWEAIIGTDPNVANTTEDGGDWAETNGTYNHNNVDWAHSGSQS